MRFTRRTFLQVLGGTAGAAVVAKGQLSSKVGAAAEDIERWATPRNRRSGRRRQRTTLVQSRPGGRGYQAVGHARGGDGSIDLPAMPRRLRSHGAHARW